MTNTKPTDLLEEAKSISGIAMIMLTIGVMSTPKGADGKPIEGAAAKHMTDITASVEEIVHKHLVELRGKLREEILAEVQQANQQLETVVTA